MPPGAEAQARAPPHCPLSPQTDIVKAIARLIEFYKHESCGQCTPCREGRHAGQAEGFSVAHAGPGWGTRHRWRGWGTGHRWRGLRTLNALLQAPSLLWLLSDPRPLNCTPWVPSPAPRPGGSAGRLLLPRHRCGLDEQGDGPLCEGRCPAGRDRLPVGDQQAERGPHHLRPGRWGCVARAGMLPHEGHGG